jgi:hypothetical protein
MIKKIGNKYVVYSKDGGKKLGTHESKKKAQKQLAAIEISKHMRAEIRKLVKRVLLESDSLGTGAARERALQIAKSVVTGEEPNTNQISGYDKEYVVIGRTFDKLDDLAGHKYTALYTLLVNKNEDEIVINRINLGTGDGATFVRTNMDGFGKDSRIPSMVRDILYDYFGIPDPLMSSF